MQKGSNLFIPAIASLRVILASFVFLYHYYNSSDLYLTPEQSFLLIKFCMTAFFALSGFVITYSLLNNPVTNSSEYKIFFLNKLIRLYPLYLVLYLVPFINIKFPNPIVFICNLFLIKGYFKELALSGIGPAWSLTTELTFYFFAPIIVKSIASTKKALAIFLTLFCTGLIAVYIVNSLNYLSLYGLFHDIFFTLETTFFGKLLDFYVGVFLAFHFKNKNYKSLKLIGWLNYSYFACFLLILICLAVLIFNIQVDQNNRTSILFQNLLMPIIAGLLLLGLITEETLLKKIFTHKWMLILSNGSYGFYLMHTSWVQYKISKINPLPDNGFVLLWVVATITYYFFEKPTIMFLRKRILL